jgi:hypothetical protein
MKTALNSLAVVIQVTQHALGPGIAFLGKGFPGFPGPSEISAAESLESILKFVTVGGDYFHEGAPPLLFGGSIVRMSSSLPFRLPADSDRSGHNRIFF